MHRGNYFYSVDEYSWKNLKMHVYFLSQTHSFSFCVLLFDKAYTRDWEILICTQVYALDFAFRRARRLKKSVQRQSQSDVARQFAVMETHSHKHNQLNSKIPSHRVASR